jgi:hypothetical protein
LDDIASAIALRVGAPLTAHNHASQCLSYNAVVLVQPSSDELEEFDRLNKPRRELRKQLLAQQDTA